MAHLVPLAQFWSGPDHFTAGMDELMQLDGIFHPSVTSFGGTGQAHHPETSGSFASLGSFAHSLDILLQARYQARGAGVLVAISQLTHTWWFCRDWGYPAVFTQRTLPKSATASEFLASVAQRPI